MEVFGGILVLVVLLILGVPVAITFLLSAMFIVITTGTDPAFLLSYGYRQTSSVVLLSIPLFIMAGSIMNAGGIGKQLIDVVSRFVGSIKGGLAVVAIVSCSVFGAICGSAAATLSSIGSIMYPRLKEKGYPLGIVGAMLASSGVLGMLIPPSGLMILYGWMGGVSVLSAFLAIVTPGIILTTLLSLVTLYMLKDDPNVVVMTKQEIRDLYNEQLRTRKINNEAGPSAALIMPVLILGSIYTGVMTPTEAAAFSVVYSIPVGIFVYKKLTLNKLKESFVDAAIATGTIMILTITVQMLSRMYVNENLPQKVLEILTSISDNRWVIMIMLNLFMVFLGMIMDDTSATLLATPILVPIVKELGFSPVHFAGILAVNIGMANVTPPCAPLLYFSGRICGVSVSEMIKPTIKYIVFAWIPTLILTIFCPILTLWLPKLLGYAY